MQSRRKNPIQQQQQLAEAISQINGAAFEHSQKKQYEAAIKKLKQAQQLLEYAAESCQHIRRQLIIVILHNIVSLSQIRWDLATASNYLEGLIYNLELTSSSKNNSKITLDESPASNTLLHEDLAAHKQLAQYYLQYCAINSQLRKHRNAQSAAKKSLRIIVALIRQSQWAKTAKNDQIHQFETKRSILKYLLDHWQSANQKEHTSNFIVFCEHLWKQQIGTHKKTSIQAQLRTFSIGNVMTLEYRHIQQQKAGQFSQKNIYNFMLMSMSLFSLATQVRFENEEKINDAKHYHALALLFYFIYIPYESPYIQHIKQNYTKNYGPLPNSQQSALLTYSELLSKIRRDSVLESSLNLQQQSVNSLEQQKRRNQRLKQQNLRLKMLCLAQVKPKRLQKSYEKAKSLTISHANAKKLSIDSKRHNDKNSKNINKTNLDCCGKAQNGHNLNRKHKNEKEALGNHKRDEMAERYFQMAFKKDKIRSPQNQRKTSIRSTSSTTKDKSGNEYRGGVRKSKQKISTIKSKKMIRK